MLKIKNLCKTFPKTRSSNKEVHALKDINLHFSKNDLVFIVGKSGSGKSTLLNIIGTLDKPTSGDLLILNKDYSKLTTKDKDALRQNIAFVFQDFALIDELNVFDNIKMARNDVTDADVFVALKKVELEGYEKRKTKTLSAGQKQRVAIARSIVKNPKIILCDEPTGNLDFVTSQSILRCLKDISKDVLVLLVSHNLDDAYTYGSRIVELDNGELVKDIVIDQEHENKPYVIQDDTLFLTTVKSISDNELEKINKKLINFEINQINPKRKLFNKYDGKITAKPQHFDLNHKKIRFKDLFKTSHKILKKQYVKTLLFSLISALVLSIFVIALEFVCFNSVNYISNSLNKYGDSAYIIASKSLNPSVDLATAPLYDNYEDSFIGEKGKDYFEIIPYEPGLTKESYTCRGTKWLMSYLSISGGGNELSAFATTGTIVMSKEAFSINLNNNKGFEIIEEADEYKPYGVYITDYYRDLLLKTNDKYLGYVTGKSVSNKEECIGYVNGVLKTDFYEKFPKAHEYFNLSTNSINKVISEDEEFAKFAHYLDQTMFTYSFEEDFVNILNNSEVKRFKNTWYKFEIPGLEIALKALNIEFEEEVSKSKFHSPSGMIYSPDDTPYNRECRPGILYFNERFGLDLTLEEWKQVFEITGNKFYINLNDYGDPNVTVDSVEYKVVGLHETHTIAFDNPYMVRKELSNLAGYKPIGLLTFDKDIFAKNISQFDDLNLKSNISDSAVAYKISDTVSVYRSLFNIILYISLAVVIAIVIFISYDAVRRQSYNIGVLKSLGVRNKEIYSVFSFHELEFMISSFIFTLLLEYLFVSLANNVLLSAISALFDYDVPNSTIISFTFSGFGTSILITLGSSLFAYCVSLFVVKSYKPINILKSKY